MPVSVSVNGSKGTYYQYTVVYEPVTVTDSVITLPENSVIFSLSGKLREGTS